MKRSKRGVDNGRHGCSAECPAWAEKVIYWREAAKEPIIEPAGVLRPYCDASRKEWPVILEEWNQTKRLTIYLCESHATRLGFKW
jgi:hypothetical protein